MLVAFFGDTHGNINTMYEVAEAWEKRTGLDLDLIVQVGDFGFWLSEDTVDAMTAKHAERLIEKQMRAGDRMRAVCGDYPDYILGELKVTKKTLVIRGNHEDQEYLMQRERKHQIDHPEDYLTLPIEMVPNMFYLPDGHIWNVNGVKFGALGGNFSIKTFENWNYWDEARHKKTRCGERRRLNHFTRDRWELLMRSEADVLLFHDAPMGMRLVGATGLLFPDDEMTEKIYGQLGCPKLNELIETVKPKRVFCGHWHQFRREGFNLNKFGKPETEVIVLNQTGIPPQEDCMMVVEL